MYNLIETTNGKFEVIATGMSYVQAENQAMFLQTFEAGTFRAIKADIKSADELRDWQNSVTSGSSWDYL